MIDEALREEEEEVERASGGEGRCCDWLERSVGYLLMHECVLSLGCVPIATLKGTAQ